MPRETLKAPFAAPGVYPSLTIVGETLSVFAKGRAMTVTRPRKLRIHEFTHRGRTYHVGLEDLDGQPFAVVYASLETKRPLLPFPDEVPAGLSPKAIRLGYIAAAEWLVKNDRWPDAETRAALLRADLEAA